MPILLGANDIIHRLADNDHVLVGNVAQAHTEFDNNVFPFPTAAGCNHGHAIHEIIKDGIKTRDTQASGIARALALNPKLIVADEAVSALDVSIQSQILNLMQELKGKFNLSYIFISHNLSVVKHISDRVGVMYLGQLVESSGKRDLYRSPLHPYTQALLSAALEPKRDGLGQERIILQGDVPSPANPPKGCPFHTRCRNVMVHCKEERPLLKEAEPDHFVACHLYH